MLVPGVNSQIVSVIAVLIWNPPRMYSLLLNTAKPPGRVMPSVSPGQGEAMLSITSVTGL